MDHVAVDFMMQKWKFNVILFKLLFVLIYFYFTQLSGIHIVSHGNAQGRA